MTHPMQLTKKTLITRDSNEASEKLANKLSAMTEEITQNKNILLSRVNDTLDIIRELTRSQETATKDIDFIKKMVCLSADNERLRAISVGIAITMLTMCVLFSTLTQRTAISICLACALLCTCFAFFRH